MRNMTIAEAAWLAGIIDGEGSIYIMKQHRKDRERTFNYILRLTVQSADNIMARRCFEITEEGSFHHCNEKRLNQSNTLRWQSEGKKSVRILKAILPYLQVKKEQAEAAIAFQETTKKHWRNMEQKDYQSQEDFYYLLKQLKLTLKLGNDTVEYQNANKVFKTESDMRCDTFLN